MEPRPIDVHHLGRERVICCWQVGDVLIDPGPESAMETLVEALGGRAPRALLLTHIHLDHAGAAGSLVRRWPELEVYVHERGAPHLADPSSLLESARRLYGDDLERLWGEGSLRADHIEGRDVKTITVERRGRSEDEHCIVVIRLHSGPRFRSPRIGSRLEARAVATEIVRRLGIAAESNKI